MRVLFSVILILSAFLSCSLYAMEIETHCNSARRRSVSAPEEYKDSHNDSYSVKSLIQISGELTILERSIRSYETELIKRLSSNAPTSSPEKPRNAKLTLRQHIKNFQFFFFDEKEDLLQVSDVQGTNIREEKPEDTVQSLPKRFETVAASIEKIASLLSRLSEVEEEKEAETLSQLKDSYMKIVLSYGGSEEETVSASFSEDSQREDQRGEGSIGRDEFSRRRERVAEANISSPQLPAKSQPIKILSLQRLATVHSGSLDDNSSSEGRKTRSILRPRSWTSSPQKARSMGKRSFTVMALKSDRSMRSNNSREHELSPDKRQTFTPREVQLVRNAIAKSQLSRQEVHLFQQILEEPEGL